MSPPRFGPKSAKLEKPKKKKKNDGNFTWLETSVNGGAVILGIIRDAASMAPVPYLRQAAAMAGNIINMIQTMQDNKADFRRLGQDAATLTAAVIESYNKSEDQDKWPGEKLESVIQTLVETLKSIEDFAVLQLQRNRFARVMNHVGDGHKIKEFRERLGAAMNRFELSAHLQSYELLRLMKGMMEDYTKHLKEASPSLEGPPATELVPAVPAKDDSSSSDEDRGAQVKRDEELARELLRSDHEAKEKEVLAVVVSQERELEAVKQRAALAELEAEKQKEVEAAQERERKAADEQIRMILEIMKEQEKKKEEEPEQPKKGQDKRKTTAKRRQQEEEDETESESEEEETSEDESSEDELIRWAMKEATAKRKAREANRKNRDQTLLAHLSAMNIGGGHPHPPYRGPWDEHSGHTTNRVRYNVGNDNSTYIKKVIKRV